MKKDDRRELRPEDDIAEHLEEGKDVPSTIDAARAESAELDSLMESLRSDIRETIGKGGSLDDVLKVTAHYLHTHLA